MLLSDWKHAVTEYLCNPGDIMGADFVGTVVEIGSEVPESAGIKLGQIRWGFIRPLRFPSTGVQRGAFAEYIAIEYDMAGLVPDNITPQQAASIPIPFGTAAMSLFYWLGLPEYPKKANGEWLLVWSGVSPLPILPFLWTSLFADAHSSS